MRKVHMIGAARAALPVALVAACLSSCTSQWQECGSGAGNPRPTGSTLVPASGAVEVTSALPAGNVGRLAPGYYGSRRYSLGAGGPYRPHRVHALHASVQLTPQAGAKVSGAGVKLGGGEGWSVTFADNFFGGEGWIGGARYDVKASPSDAGLFFIRGGFRMAYLDVRPLYAFVAAGVSLDWLYSSEFPTLYTVNVGDEDDFAPFGFYFRFGAGLAFANVLAFAEFATTSAWVSDADFLVDGWLSTWGASIGLGIAF